MHYGTLITLISNEKQKQKELTFQHKMHSALQDKKIIQYYVIYLKIN